MIARIIALLLVAILPCVTRAGGPLINSYRYAAAATPVDILISFENGNNADALTDTNLAAGVVGTVGTVALFPSSPNTLNTISTVQALGAATGFSVGGVVQSAGTRSLRANVNQDNSALPAQYGRIPFAAAHNQVSVGFGIFLPTGFNASWSGTYDLFGLVAGPGEFFYWNYWDQGSGNSPLTCHTQAGKGASIVMTSAINKWLWATVIWDRTGLLATLKLYDATTSPYTLIGTSTNPLLDQACSEVQVGRIDVTSSLLANAYYTDCVAVKFDTTAEVFPAGKAP